MHLIIFSNTLKRTHRISFKNMSNTYPCHCACGFFLLNGKRVSRHINGGCPMKYPQCPICHKKFLNGGRSIGRHMKSHYKIIPNRRLSEFKKKPRLKINTCNTCNKCSTTCYTMRDWIIHNNDHHREKF
jgi:hypothetical protein